MISKPAITNWSPFADPSAYNPPTSWQICSNIAEALEFCGGSQLIENLQHAIDDIFCVNNGRQPFSAPLSLLTIAPDQFNDYQAYYDLLKVNGPVFRAIDRLMRSEPNWCYREDACQLLAGRFPKERSQVLGHTPFEYFVYRFAQHLLMAVPIYPHADFDRLDCVYVALMVDYLTNFLPSDGVFPSFLVSTPSASATPASVDRRSDPYLLLNNFFNQNRSAGLGLLRAEAFRDNISASGFSASKPQTTKFSEVLSKSITLVSILVNTWLAVPDSGLSSASFVGGISTIGTPRGTATISGVTAVVMRVLVEHLHRFAYSPSSSIVDYQIRDFKENFVPELIETPMWKYLLNAFDKWPLDSSFRHLLELWLAYVQPWQYASSHYQQQYDTNYNDRWEPFVKMRVPFYTTFLRRALFRFLRMDLSSCKNAFELYRTAHVFSQSNLTVALELANIDQISPIRLRDSFDPDAISKMVVEVTERARDASRYCQKVIAEQRRAERQLSWTSWLVNQLLGVDENTHLAELERTRDCLDASVQNFEHAFGFRLPEEMSNGKFHDEAKTPLHSEKQPDCRADEDGRLRLTPLGRRQLLNANRRFDFSRVRHPSDLAPVDRSMEIDFLAKFLQSISSRINSNYARRFEILYRQSRGVVPWVFRKVLEPPTRIIGRDSPVIERHPTDLKARVNLRPLASYRFLFRFCFVLFCSGLLLGFPTVIFGSVVFLAIFVFWMYCVLKYHPKVLGD